MNSDLSKRCFSAVLAAVVLTIAIGAKPAGRAADEAAIHKAVSSYVTAFNQKDSKALAALWSPDAIYTNRLTGEEATGREAIRKEFAATFADEKRTRLEATTESIEFVSPSVAVEQGMARLIRPDQEVEESKYTAIYIKRDGRWLLDRVTEEEAEETPSHYEQLKELDWLVGRWVDQDDDSTVVTECNWTRNNNFLVRSFTVQIRDQIDMAGIQIIGWDPVAQQIRSWVFDSDGGFGEGTWKKKDNRWYIYQKGVLPDGGKSSSVNVIAYLDENTCTLQSINRTLDGELLPNVDEVELTRE